MVLVAGSNLTGFWLYAELFCILLLVFSLVSARPFFDLMILKSAKLSHSLLGGVKLMTKVNSGAPSARGAP